MSDNRATADWGAAAERWAAELQQMAAAASGQLIDSSELVTALTPRAQIVAAMLMAEDDKLHHMLGNLHRRLRQWVPLNDHQVSWADGMLAGHLAADRNLAAAVADLVDVIEPQPAAQTAEQLADRIAADIEQETSAYMSQSVLRLIRLHSCISDLRGVPVVVNRDQLVTLAAELLHLCDHLGIRGQSGGLPSVQLPDRIAASMQASMQQILDDLPLTDSSNRQLRDAIDRLCDRAQFWQEHPGEEWDGQELACVLMPIITQLLEHSQQGDAT